LFFWPIWFGVWPSIYITTLGMRNVLVWLHELGNVSFDSTHRTHAREIHRCFVHDSPHWTQPSPPTIERASKVRIMEYYTAMRTDGQLLQVRTWVRPQDVSMIPRIWNSKQAELIHRGQRMVVLRIWKCFGEISRILEMFPILI
jgi:hypothetical protein